MVGRQGGSGNGMVFLVRGEGRAGAGSWRGESACGGGLVAILQLSYQIILGMSVPESTHSLIAELVLWVEGVSFEYKQVAFEKIKRKVLREDLRKLHKSSFSSISSTSENNYTTNALSNYVSISDFKPIEQNYSSVKIIDYQTHGIKNDIKTSLAKKIEYTSNQLFNKETFLQAWMTRQKISQLMPENYPFSDYAVKKITSYHDDALNSVRRFTFTQHCKYNLKKKSGFFSLTEADPLKYKATMISSSLTYLSERENEVALESFEYLLRAGGEVQGKFNPLYEVNQLVELIFTANDNIKEEVFFQAIKQISSKKQIYARIMCCLCYCVKPSTRMYIPLLNYFYEEATLYENLPKELLNYCFFHLIKNFDHEKKYTPSIFELYCAFHAAKIPIILAFPKEKVFFVQSYTSVEEFMSELIEYYNLDTNIEYLLEINGFLMERGNLLDNLNHYSILGEEDYKWKDYQLFSGLHAVIVLKNVNDINTSPRCHSIMYNYCANQYIRGLYSLRSTDIVKIAALKMHSEMEDEENYKFEYENLITKRKLRTLTSPAERANYKKHILKNYYKIRHLNKIEARREILQILSKSKGFNTHFFKCEIFIEDYDEFVAWVGVQKDRLIVVQPTTGRIMRVIFYNRIKEWGQSKSELCLKVDFIGEFHIDCRQVEVLASVFQTYLNYNARALTAS